MKIFLIESSSIPKMNDDLWNKKIRISSMVKITPADVLIKRSTVTSFTKGVTDWLGNVLNKNHIHTDF